MLTDPGADRHKTDNNERKIKIMFEFAFLQFVSISASLIFALGPKVNSMSIRTAHAKMNEYNVILCSYCIINRNMALLGLLLVEKHQ